MKWLKITNLVKINISDNHSIAENKIINLLHSNTEIRDYLYFEKLIFMGKPHLQYCQEIGGRVQCGCDYKTSLLQYYTEQQITKKIEDMKTFYHMHN